jgi:hypothetical protein
VAASSSSSSSGAAATFAVWLYDGSNNRVALVDVPVPMPNAVTFQGYTYVWSNVHWYYQQTVPFAAVSDVGLAALSPLSNPQQ